MSKKHLSYILTLFLICHSLHADLEDPFDPFADPFNYNTELQALSPDDQNKTSEQLIREAILLQHDNQPLESRTKLLMALQKDPKQFRAHMALSDYYSRYVGHFRLAMKYALQAENLLVEEFGHPPYKSFEAQSLHSDVLNLLAHGRLNLDDYQGAFKTWEQYEKFGYFSPYFPSSKAWVLMKLGRLPEAIQTARMGLLVGASPGHTLNILGILLSMTGERQTALSTFQEALRYEMSLGVQGNPSTPLNNSGEVHKELFMEDNAKQSWLAAIQLPDGCEHVLPSLNLSMLNMDELELLEAKKAIDSFEACVAQFPLKNGEEHRALVKMARARIALHSGFPDQAIELLKDALDHQQWFGKIGTTIEDLQAGLLMSLHQAYLIQNNQLRLQSYQSWQEYLAGLKQRITNAIKAKWAARRARELLAYKLNTIEDLFIRNTDSMLEYPALGTLLATFPRAVINSRVLDFKKKDQRTIAQNYYLLYEAESDLNSGYNSRALQKIDQVLTSLRAEVDLHLKAHALSLRLKAIDQPTQQAYIQTSYDLLALHPPAILNQAIILKLNGTNLTAAVTSILRKSALYVDNSQDLPLNITYSFDSGQHFFHVQSKVARVPEVRIRAGNIYQAVNELKQALFTKT